MDRHSQDQGTDFKQMSLPLSYQASGYDSHKKGPVTFPSDYSLMLVRKVIDDKYCSNNAGSWQLVLIIGSNFGRWLNSEVLSFSTIIVSSTNIGCLIP